MMPDLMDRSMKFVLAFAVCASTCLLQPMTGIVTASTAPADLTKEIIDNGAAKYARAVTELSRIATMSLVTEQDFKKASSIIDENIGGLRFVRYRTVQIALSNRSFTRAVEAELNKAASAGRCVSPLCGGGSAAEQDAAFEKLGRNPRPLLELDGARETTQSMETEVRRDFQALEKAGQYMHQAAENAQRSKAAISAPTYQNHRKTVKARFEVPTDLSGPVTSVPDGDVIDFLRSLFVATSITTNLVQWNGGGGPKGIKSTTGGGGVGGGRGGPRADTSYLDNDSNYDNCVSKAAVARASCKGLCYPGMFQWACLGSCDGAYLASAGLCVFGVR